MPCPPSEEFLKNTTRLVYVLHHINYTVVTKCLFLISHVVSLTRAALDCIRVAFILKSSLAAARPCGDCHVSFIFLAVLKLVTL